MVEVSRGLFHKALGGCFTGVKKSIFFTQLNLKTIQKICLQYYSGQFEHQLRVLGRKIEARFLKFTFLQVLENDAVAKRIAKRINVTYIHY